MRITKIIAVSCLFALFTHCCAIYGWTDAEEKVTVTTLGKVISGIDEETALKRYGAPASVKGRLWYYTKPENFYVYLSIPLTVNLYPEFSESKVGIPLELKVLKSSADSESIDVTVLSKLIFSDPRQFEVLGPGVIVPKEAGRFTVMAVYKKIHSNPSYITVGLQTKENKKDAIKQNLVIFPYNPVVDSYDVITFSAFATLYSGRYFKTEEVSRKAMWFLRQPDGYTVTLNNPRVKFEKKGKYSIFCKFEEIVSLPLEVEVKKKSSSMQERIRNFAVIPGYVSAKKDDAIAFRAIITYNDNATEDVTSNVYWEAAGNNILVKSPSKSNVFSAKSIGATVVTARLADRTSSPVKVVVGTENAFFQAPEKVPVKEIPKKPNELLKDIKDDIKQLKQEAAKKPPKIEYIKLVPEYIKVPLGQDGQFKALGGYSDNTETDITILADWHSTNEKVASAWKGKAVSYSMGEAEIYVSYKGVESQRAVFVVEEPKLVSIAVQPANLKIRIDEKVSLKAEGYFTDSSRKDITSLVSWDIDNPRLLALPAAVVNPLRIGTARVYAEYLGIKSPPVDITILRQKFWLLKLIAKIAVSIFGLLFAAFIYLHLMTIRQKNKMISLRQNTRDFIICLYGNLCKILDIFGAQYSNTLPPLSYAQDVEKRYCVVDKLFFRITVRFEEAKYSAHILDPQLSEFILEDYNAFLRIIISQEKKPSLYYRYCLVLMGRIPLGIRLSPGAQKDSTI